jgi:hypothetical protein
MHAGSPSLIVASIHPVPPCRHNTCLLLRAINYTSVLSSFPPYTFSRLKVSVYCCLALALGAHSLDSSYIDLAYLNWDFFCHLWVQIEASQVNPRTRSLTAVANYFSLWHATARLCNLLCQHNWPRQRNQSTDGLNGLGRRYS